jgi:uncharacterized protein GlcG (DUF336 family)
MKIFRRRTATAKPRLEALEDRLSPNASAALVDGTLFVSGDNGRNAIQVSADAGDLVVIDNGSVVNRVASSRVLQLAIVSGDGNTTVRVAADVMQPATIEGVAGQDVLMAGGGPTTLIAGTGPTKLVGGPAADILIAGGPNDILIGRSVKDEIQLGFGNDKVYAAADTVIVGAQASDRIYQQLPADPPSDPGIPPDSPLNQLTPTDVNTLLERAAAATPSDDAIVAVVDREGNILGVRVEQNVSPAITGNLDNLVFAIDGAVAEARTGAWFASSFPNGAPLTSRTVQFISQSTITQREVQSNPSIPDPNSTLRGPGFVAPIGIGAHFPPNIDFTPMVDLFDIESTNRDTTNPRFNAIYLPGQSIPAPVSYGVQSGLLPTAEPRGIGTLPGGIPIYKGDEVVGGIGVFFPGTTGYATEENSSLNQALFDPSKPDRSLEAELIAFTAVGGASMVASCQGPAGAFDFRGPIGSAPALPADFGLPSNGIITLVGVRLDVVGPGGPNGPDVLLDLANRIGFGQGNPLSGVNERVTMAGAPTISAADLAADLAMVPPPADVGNFLLGGTAVPTGWLVAPHAGTGLTAADVTTIINQGIAEANQIRAAIRLPLDSTARMVFAVTDLNGNVLGLYRMPDATYFSIGVAVAKARNVAYYDNPAALQPIDQLPGIAAGVAFTNRTFRYLADPRFPEGIDGAPPGPFSILKDGGTNPQTGAEVGPPLPASAFTSVEGNNAFNPDTNFHQPPNPNQNGIVFFPGSMPLYKDGAIVGGLGVSGDGVDQDDVVTFFASNGYQPSQNGVLRSDQVYFQGLLLPFQNFNRNPPA